MALNLNTDSFSFGSGGSDFNFDPDRWAGAFSSATELQGGNTFIQDGWNTSLGFLSEGLNIYKDYLNVSGKNPYMQAAMSPDQYSEQQYQQAVQRSGQFINGVDNGILLLAGAAIAVVLFTS
jgi:hypothetical protein